VSRARRTQAATLAAAAALAAMVACPAPARATVSCPVPVGVSPSVGAIDGRARLDWIDARLGRTAHRAKVWTWGWGVGIGVATVGNLVPLLFVKPEDRIDWYVAAGTTVIGVVPLLIAPLDVVGDSRALRVRVDALDHGPAPPTDAQICRELALAETMLARDAKNQQDGQRWWVHVGNVVLNAGVGLFLGIGYHHWLGGAINFGTGVVIGEAIILTQPTGTIEDHHRYTTGALDLGAPQVGLGYTGRF
jgi:hypothetical protein